MNLSVKWYSFVADTGNYQLKVKSIGGNGKVSKAVIFSGECGNLLPEAGDTTDLPNDSTLELSFYNNYNNSKQYYLLVYNNGPGSINYQISSLLNVSIEAPVAICSGTCTNLIGYAYNGTGNYSYSWFPGNISGQQISVCPNSPTTYTLIVTDISTTFTISTTHTISILPSNLCNNCSNIVYNGDFEYNIGCSQLNWQSNGYQGPPWQDINSTDYYNSCSPTCGTISPDVCLPTNIFGVEGNHTGTNPNQGGYLGLYLASQPIYHEYIFQKLKCPLYSGQAYSVSMYASSAEIMKFISSDFGAYFRSGPIINLQNGTLPVSPQVSAGAIIGCNGWSTITGQITGANEDYMYIGNFNYVSSTVLNSNPNFNYNPSGSPLMTNPNGIPGAYVYIDDVTVSPIPPTYSCNVSAVNCGQPSTITLTANGAASAYTTWSNGVNTWNGATVTIPAPTSNTTYTCTVSLPCGSCSTYTGTVTVPVNSMNSCWAPINYTVTTISTGTVNVNFGTTAASINNNLTITGAGTVVNLSGDNILLYNNVKIIVTNGATLNIDKSWLHSCCSMWGGD